MYEVKTKIKQKRFGWLGAGVKTYDFKIIVEPDEDRWHAYCPALKKHGVATWGYTKEEALKNIQEVAQMVVEELVEDGEYIPEEPKDEVQVFLEPRVAITV
ncbi:MAG: type II toxin-antitoxin system HicB family antitoxin [bacterium]